jgi:glucokinase
MTTTASKPLRLIADVGGTNARFALSPNPGAFDQVRVLACAQFPTIADAVRHYLAEAGQPAVDDVVIAIATPLLGDEVRMTNHHWSFSIEQTRRDLHLRTLLVINDFSALAMSLPFLPESGLRRLDRHEEKRQGVKAVVGPGTGLGVAGLVPTPHGWQPVATEGGHVSLAPGTPLEAEILQVLWKDYAHVSAERLVSGLGIPLLYRTLCTINGTQPAAGAADAAGVVALADAASGTAANQTLSVFSKLLGSVAGNVALTFGSTGGLYIGGGVVARLGRHFDIDAFRERFLSKGRFAAYLEAVPNYLIVAEQPAFIGAARQLEQHLAQQAHPASRP